MTTDTSLITFKAIVTFVNELEETFGDEHRSLKLYAKLLNRTTLAHNKPIKKHIDSFSNFCIKNRESILNKNSKEFIEYKILYSQRVFIDMKEIFSLISKDKETEQVIWKHLLFISARVDPTGQAKQLLKDQQSSKGNGEEVDFLSDIISKVESSVDPDADPMQAVSSIMSSGVFTELVQGMGNGLQDGSLDLPKLMSTVQTMVTKLNDQVDPNQEGGDNAVNMINTMMNNMNAGLEAPDNDGTPQPMPDLSAMGPMLGMLGGQGGGGDGMPDLSALGPMLGMLGGQGGGTDGMPNIAGMLNTPGKSGNSIEDTINAQVAAAKKSGDLPLDEPHTDKTV